MRSANRKINAPLLVVIPVPIARAQSRAGDERSFRDARTKKQCINKMKGAGSRKRVSAETTGVAHMTEGTGGDAGEMRAETVEAVRVTVETSNADTGAEDRRGDVAHHRCVPNPAVAVLMDVKEATLREEGKDAKSVERFSG